MGFQNSINNMLGTAGAVATLGKHMKNQQESLANQEKELAAGEAQRQLQIKELEYANEKDNIEYLKKKADLASEMRANPLTDKEGNIITDPIAYKAQQLDNITENITKYKQGKRKEAAIKARDALQDEMFTFTDLKFDMEKRKEQINILKGVK